MVSLAQQLERALMARRHPLSEAVLAAQLEMQKNVGRPPTHIPSKPGTQSGSVVIEDHADAPGLVEEIIGDGPGKKAQEPAAQTRSNNPNNPGTTPAECVSGWTKVAARKTSTTPPADPQCTANSEKTPPPKLQQQWQQEQQLPKQQSLFAQLAQVHSAND